MRCRLAVFVTNLFENSGNNFGPADDLSVSRLFIIRRERLPMSRNRSSECAEGSNCPKDGFMVFSPTFLMRFGENKCNFKIAGECLTN